MVAKALARLALSLALILIFFSLMVAVLGTQFPLLVVKSGSMRPTIEPGDIIVIQGVSYNQIYASPVNGDVIVFYSPWSEERGQLIVHRAIEKTERGIITKGDANSLPDPWSPIPPENIVGKWTGLKIPYWTGLGFLSLTIKGEINRPLGIVIIAVLVLLNAVLIARDIINSRRRSL